MPPNKGYSVAVPLVQISQQLYPSVLHISFLSLLNCMWQWYLTPQDTLTCRHRINLARHSCLTALAKVSSCQSVILCRRTICEQITCIQIFSFLNIIFPHPAFMTRSHSAWNSLTEAQAAFEFAQSSCFSLLYSGITGVSYRAQLRFLSILISLLFHLQTDHRLNWKSVSRTRRTDLAEVPGP